MIPLELTVVRHAQSIGNEASSASVMGDHSLFTGEVIEQRTKDWRLTEKGINHARETGEWIRANIAKSFDFYFVSDFPRAIHTAELLGFDAKWEQTPLLGERDWGEVHGKLPHPQRAEYLKAHGVAPKQDSIDWVPPGGEPFRAAMGRVDTFNKQHLARYEGKRGLVVAHSGTIQAMRMLIWRTPEDQFLEFVKKWVHNCHVLHYSGEREGGGYAYERSAAFDWDGNFADEVRKIA